MKPAGTENPQESVVGMFFFSNWPKPFFSTSANPEATQNSDTNMFDDDLVLHCQMKIFVSIVRNCTEIENWMEANKLTLNRKITQFMVTSGKKSFPQATWSNNFPKTSQTVKHIGVIVD